MARIECKCGKTYTKLTMNLWDWTYHAWGRFQCVALRHHNRDCRGRLDHTVVGGDVVHRSYANLRDQVQRGGDGEQPGRIR